MFCCNEKAAKALHDQFNVKAEETEKGVKVEVTTKDPAKTDALKQLFKLHKVFFKDCCK